MRLIILTQYYPPEVGAPQNRLSDLAMRLVGMGHEVVVLTAMPNYPKGVVFPEYRRQFHASEVRDGVQIHRAWVFATPSRSVALRLLNYFSFVVSALVVGAVKLPRADFIMTESPPLFLGLSGLLLARLTRAQPILNVSDLFAEGLIAAKIVREGWIVRATRCLERSLCERSWLVTGQTPTIVDRLRQLAPRARVRLLSNGVNVERFNPDRADLRLLREFSLEGRFVVGYAGLHGRSQALEHVVEAAARLTDYPDIVIAMFGEGPVKADLQRQAETKGLGNIRFFDQQAAERIPQLLPLWSVGLVPLFGAEVGRSARPSKMFEVMAAGVPMILSAPDGDATALIKAAHAGLCVAPENPDAIADGIKRLYHDPNRRALGENGRRYVTQHFDRGAIAHAFVQLLAPTALPTASPKVAPASPVS